MNVASEKKLSLPVCQVVGGGGSMHFLSAVGHSPPANALGGLGEVEKNLLNSCRNLRNAVDGNTALCIGSYEDGQVAVLA